jgi:hypothetical protein
MEQALIKSFCGVQGRFFQKEPLAAGGEKNFFVDKRKFLYFNFQLIQPCNPTTLQPCNPATLQPQGEKILSWYLKNLKTVGDEGTTFLTTVLFFC